MPKRLRTFRWLSACFSVFSQADAHVVGDLRPLHACTFAKQGCGLTNNAEGHPNLARRKRDEGSTRTTRCRTGSLRQPKIVASAPQFSTLTPPTASQRPSPSLNIHKLRKSHRLSGRPLTLVSSPLPFTRSHTVRHPSDVLDDQQTPASAQREDLTGPDQGCSGKRQMRRLWYSQPR